MIKNNTENLIKQMPQLEEDGAIDVKYHDIELESGFQYQEFTGIYQATGITFKHMVYLYK